MLSGSIIQCEYYGLLLGEQVPNKAENRTFLVTWHSAGVGEVGEPTLPLAAPSRPSNSERRRHLLQGMAMVSAADFVTVQSPPGSPDDSCGCAAQAHTGPRTRKPLYPLQECVPACILLPGHVACARCPHETLTSVLAFLLLPYLLPSLTSTRAPWPCWRPSGRRAIASVVSSCARASVRPRLPSSAPKTCRPSSSESPSSACLRCGHATLTGVPTYCVEGGTGRGE